MTSNVQSQRLPEYLLTCWRMEKDEAWQARKRKDFRGWRVSSLAETYLKYQFQRYHRIQEKQEQEKASVPKLSHIAAARVLEVLNASENLDADLGTITRSLNSTTVRQLLTDPRTPYPVLRGLQSYLRNHSNGKIIDEQRGIVDIDEAILSNERYIRSRADANRDNKYLVTLKELSRILVVSAGGRKDDVRLEFVRQDPPKGGLELLDGFRERVMQVQPNDEMFAKTFDRITKGALKGLDWDNVLIAGGMALTTLTHVDRSNDDGFKVRDCDIDLYLYGLSPEEANRKVEEIYNIWSTNLPSTNQQKLVVKNAKTINLLPSYPNRRLQIILKLLSSPTQILLNFDLDACAIGFDGSRVLMLPRFARAVETGYSVFTMDLVWGHHLGNRRATQERRVFKYADRGFGIRILPSYAKSLEEDTLERALGNMKPAYEKTNRMNDDKVTHDELDYPPMAAELSERNRKPAGPEPGLKTLKRVAYLGQDFVNRFYFGATPLVTIPDLLDSDEDMSNPGDTNDRGIHEESEAGYTAALREVSYVNKALQELDENQKLTVATEYGPYMSLAALDTNRIHEELPDGRRGLGAFEIFTRHCEAWRLHAHAEATLDENSFASTVYDPETYDDLPTYPWDETLDLDRFAQAIDDSNNRLFGRLKVAICHKLSIGFRNAGYSDYLTRRIRRQVHGPDLASVQEKQITIPLMLPWDLENFILSDIPNQYADLPQHFTVSKPLIPIHDPTTHDPTTSTLPPLHDTVNESGNLRYWVITNDSMWAGQHCAMDDATELLWSLFHWLNQETHKEMHAFTNGPGTDAEQCVWYLARLFRRRVVLPEVPSDAVSQANTLNRRRGLPTPREALLFRRWVFYTPKIPKHDFINPEDHIGRPHGLFDAKRVLYPFPDALFWDDGDEGRWDGEGVPVWKDVGRDAKAGQGVRRSADLTIQDYVLPRRTKLLLRKRQGLRHRDQISMEDSEADD